jgi:CubicO group peptidase (beta-lactamase class C family)
VSNTVSNRSLPRLLMTALGLILGAGLVSTARGAPQDSAPKAAEEAFGPVVGDFKRLIDEGRVVGGQLVVGDLKGIILERSFGTRGPADKTLVDEETMFCIGSCSKPFASACILSLVADGTLNLDEPINHWLPEFRSPMLESGAAAAARAPNLRELLAHRGGLYSQKKGMTARQTSWIRDFSIPLDRSVRGIAAEPLIAEPGSSYAYSGAGYCVLGRVAEVAASKPFEALLQERVIRPLGMSRTTYFPPAGESNVAAGAIGTRGQATRDPVARQLLAADHRLPLIGGSLFTTARQEARFARMILDNGRSGPTQIIPATVWGEVLRRQFPGTDYGLGWGQTFDARDQITTLQHTGQLGSYSSYLRIDRESGCFVILHWTVFDNSGQVAEDKPKDLPSLTPAAREALNRFGTSLRAIQGGAINIKT